MAGFHRLSLAVPFAFFLLLVVAGGLMISAATAMAVDESDDDGPPIRIRMRYANAEESRWLDSWAEKTQSAAAGAGAGDFEVRRATDEESARLNRMRADADRRARDGSDFGFDGHIEFDDDHPFGRVVVTEFPPSSKPNDDL